MTTDACLTRGVLSQLRATLVVHKDTALLFGGTDTSGCLSDLHLFDFGESPMHQSAFGHGLWPNPLCRLLLRSEPVVV